MDEAYLPLKWHLDPSSRFSTTGMRRKLAVPLWGRGSWVPSNSVAWDEAYLRTKLHLDPFSRLTTTDMADFLVGGGLCPFGGGELGPHLTQFG